MKFRKDINGLRAIAVIAVVLFHFNAFWLPGGFAGVDVFFVISGYLMTGIIFRGIENKNFSILNFYIARANRIIPSLAVLCLFLLVFGWFYLTPLDYQALGSHALSSISFFSNITYWQESGYFDAASHEKWLLHTWSLSVEWQFYIIFPLFLVVLRKFFSIKVMKIMVLIGTIFGFLLCVIMTYKLPNPSYYLLPTRAWEMLFGGVAFLYPFNMENKKQQRKYLEWFGLALIIGSYIFISKENFWPGFLAIFPVLGAFLIIQAQRDNSFITSNIISQKIGQWSYSIYLWHWPIVVAIYYFSLSEIFIYLGILSSVLLGFISHRYIEKREFKTNYSSLLTYLKCKPIWMCLLVGLISLYILKFETNDYLYPMPASVLKSTERKHYECFDKKYLHKPKTTLCQITEGNERLLAFGDSHLYATLPVIEDVSKEYNLELTYAGYSGCPPLVNVYPERSDQKYRNCKLLNDKLMSRIVGGGYEFVIQAARWTYYTEGDYSGGSLQYLLNDENRDAEKARSVMVFKKGIQDTFKKYSETEVKLIIILQVPMQEQPPLKIYYSSLVEGNLSESLLHKKSVSRRKHHEFQEITNRIIIDEAKGYSNIMIIDPEEVMCGSITCPVGDKKGSFYFDDDHLSTYGSDKLKEVIRKALYSA